MAHRLNLSSIIFTYTCCFFSGFAPLAAQETSGQDSADTAFYLDEILVTGTYLRGKTQANSPSPITVFQARNLSDIGASNIADLVQSLTINNGSQNNPDTFTQVKTTGTSNFNLRGLGVSSTLVLINGRRQVVSAAVTNDGVAFVDTSSLAPQIAYKRIEILKDGAAAIYGSDAVAGVVNFITDDAFEGVQVAGKYGFLTGAGSQSDTIIESKVGWGNDTSHFMAAFSHYDRAPLTTSDRRLSLPVNDTSALGNPGAYFLLGAIPVIDPTGCAEQGGIEQPIAAIQPAIEGLGLPYTAGFCGFEFGNHFNLVPEEARTQGYATLTQSLSGEHELRLEVAWSQNRAAISNSPSFPILQLQYTQVPDYHPDNPFPAALGPILFFGRPRGVGASSTPSYFKGNTYRVSASVKGNILNDWTYHVGLTHGSSSSDFEITDTIVANFQQALNGFGGDNCSGDVPGANGCLFFNPFSTSYTTSPNSQEVQDYISGAFFEKTTSKLTVVDAVVSGSLIELGAGPIEVAIGAQYRDEFWSRDGNDLVNADAFAFLIGSPDFDGERSVKALFAETLIPISSKINLSAAVRYEDYGGKIGETLDPKITLLYRPPGNITVRGSYSTSFRAPSVYQISGVNTSLNQVSDPLTGSTAFIAVRDLSASVEGRDIKEERGNAWNLGVSRRTDSGFSLDFDLWSYKFSDVIIEENHQAVVNADPTGDRVIRSPGGTILTVLVDFTNASSVKTSGMDINARYAFDTPIGVVTPFFEATHAFNYSLVRLVGDDPIEGVGARNFANFGSPTPAWRINAGLSYVSDAHSARFYVRHISSLDDDQIVRGVQNGLIDSMTTLDVQYSLALENIWHTFSAASLQIGVINAFDTPPPYVSTNGGFESRTHDPRGRQVYIRLEAGF
ncbi:MAG: TonB-dependent receptor [Kordiimonadaceae bacterium]|nr:TonB-dependent receptor [Kordiimonadaceae bacterium]